MITVRSQKFQHFQHSLLSTMNIDGLSSLQARLKGEMDAVIAQLESGKEFEIYIRALSLLTDIEHLRKNLGLEIEGLQSFRDFVSGTEKKVGSNYNNHVNLIVLRHQSRSHTHLCHQPWTQCLTWIAIRQWKKRRISYPKI